MFLPSSSSPAGLLGNLQEESSSSSAAKIIEKPGTFDILCGKDKTFNKHHGNRIFREMIVSYHDVYAKAVSKHDKMQITKEIVNTLQSKYNARFIKSVSSSSSSRNRGRQGGKDGAQWQEISNQVARDKVSHALRFASRPSGVAGTAGGMGSGSGSVSCLSVPHRTSNVLVSSSSNSSNSNHNSTCTRQCRRSRSCTATLTSLQAATVTAAVTTAPMLPSTSWHTVSNNSSTIRVPGDVATTSLLGTKQTTTADTATNNSMSTLRSTARSSSFNLFYDNQRSRATLAAVAALTAFDAAAFQTTLGDYVDVEPNPYNQAVVSDWEKSHNSSESSAFFEEHTYDPDQLPCNHHDTHYDDDALIIRRNLHDRKQEIMTTDDEEEDEDDEQDDTESADEDDITLSSNSAPHYLDLEPNPLPVHSQFFLLSQHTMRQPPGNDAAGIIATGTVLSRSSNDDEAINALMKEPVMF